MQYIPISPITPKALKNPSLKQEMMRSQDRQLSNIEAMPGGTAHFIFQGMNYLTRMFANMEDEDESFAEKQPASSSLDKEKGSTIGKLNTQGRL